MKIEVVNTTLNNNNKYNNMKIKTKQLSPELQREIRKEVSKLRNSNLKTQAQKKPLSDLAEAFLETVVKGSWTQRADGKIDVKGFVKLKKSLLVERVLGKEIFFGKVSRDFNCANKELTSLEGCPEYVGGDFNCDGNRLTSLEGCPEYVGKDFNCDGNRLTSLEGCPEYVGGGFNCSENNLTSLEGAPKEVKGGFYCSKNNLTSLEGAPKEVEGVFYCSENNLTSLEGCPEYVERDFICSRNNLTSLEGAPKKIKGGFWCQENNLTSLEGCPKYVGGNFNCSSNNLTSLEGASEYVGGDFWCKDNEKLTSLEGIGEVKGTIYSNLKGTIYSNLKSKPTSREEMTDEAAAELEEALFNLIKKTAPAYRNYETTGKRNDAKIRDYITQQLFTEFTSITGLVYFLEKTKSYLQSALDGASMIEGTCMVDDENWKDFIPDLQSAAQYRLQELKKERLRRY
jgi:hypothetical protein